MTEPIELRHCTSCKHYIYNDRVAQKNQCVRFSEPGEQPKPCAEVRGSNAGVCGGRGKFWEPA